MGELAQDLPRIPFTFETVLLPPQSNRDTLMNTAKTFIILFILALIGCAGLGFTLLQTKTDHRATLERLAIAQDRALADKEEQLQQTLGQQTERHEQRIQAMTQDFESKLDALRSDQRKQIADAYKEFENIFEGNRQTIEYINLLEGKVRGGQQLSKNEVEKLTVITTGLGYLQKQYQKPLQEFTELEAYFDRQAARQPTAPEKPKAGFFKRAFSKNFREAEKQFYREEGQRQAFEQAQQEFGRVYASAQQAMKAVDLNADEQVKKLYALIEEKDAANQQDLSEFFNKARQALRTHQNVLQFEPDTRLPPATPAP